MYVLTETRGGSLVKATELGIPKLGAETFVYIKYPHSQKDLPAMLMFVEVIVDTMVRSSLPRGGFFP
jgi:hypothetical protein